MVRPRSFATLAGSTCGTDADNCRLRLALAGSLSLPESTRSLARQAADGRLDDWREVAAMLSANRGAGDKEALLSLGDSLVNVGWLHAGHAW